MARHRLLVAARRGEPERALDLLSEARGVLERLGRRDGVAVCARLAARLGAPGDPALEALLPPDATVVE